MPLLVFFSYPDRILVGIRDFQTKSGWLDSLGTFSMGHFQCDGHSTGPILSAIHIYKKLAMLEKTGSVLSKLHIFHMTNKSQSWPSNNVSELHVSHMVSNAAGTS